MAVVVTVDERRSRRAARSRAAELAKLLNEQPDVTKSMPFEVTVGDELQGVLFQPVNVIPVLRLRGLTEPEIGSRLGITQQAVNQRLRAALFAQEVEGTELIQSIASEVRPL